MPPFLVLLLSEQASTELRPAARIVVLLALEAHPEVTRHRVDATGFLLLLVADVLYLLRKSQSLVRLSLEQDAAEVVSVLSGCEVVDVLE